VPKVVANNELAAGSIPSEQHAYPEAAAAVQHTSKMTCVNLHLFVTIVKNLPLFDTSLWNLTRPAFVLNLPPLLPLCLQPTSLWNLSSMSRFVSCSWVTTSSSWPLITDGHGSPCTKEER
jgi:hypothetical protein